MKQKKNEQKERRENLGRKRWMRAKIIQRTQDIQDAPSRSKEEKEEKEKNDQQELCEFDIMP